MVIRKLESSPAFVVVDVAGKPATGLVRQARKILQGSAKDMARSVTYTFASFGIRRVGASAGISVEGDARNEAVSNFAAELTADAGSGDLHLDPAKGIRSGELDVLHDASGRSGLAQDPQILAAGVVAATVWALGSELSAAKPLAGKTVAIEGQHLGPVPGAVAEAVTQAGATIVEVPGVDKKPWLIWGADVDAVLCGSKLGALTHQGAEFVKAKAIVPWATTPVTAKAFAILRRGDVTVVPDFVSASGCLLAGYLDKSHDDTDGVIAEVESRITAVLEAASKSPDGVFLGACYHAESFLDTWLDEKPFGRPLAS